jgi:hypothetical protein
MLKLGAKLVLHSAVEFSTLLIRFYHDLDQCCRKRRCLSPFMYGKSVVNICWR